MKKSEYTPETCPCCKQTTTYLVPIDPGTVHILKEIARFIGRKQINIVHPRKEMEGSELSSNDVGNLSRLRIHGLIARVKGNPGNYCMTSKGGDFLHGIPIPKYAIRSKTEHKTIGYYKPEEYTTTLDAISTEYWEGINYDIVAGTVVEREVVAPSLF